MPGTRASPAPSLCFDEPPGAWLPRLHSLLDWGGGGAGYGSLPRLGELSLPLSWRERASQRCLLPPLLLGHRHSSRRGERKWLWGPTQAPTAVLPLTSR